jgi:hypothetical protein
MTKYSRIYSHTLLGTTSSYMTLQPIPPEFPYTVYEENFLFFFIIVFLFVLIKLNPGIATTRDSNLPFTRPPNGRC